MDLDAQFAPDVLLPLQNSELALHFNSLIEATAVSQPRRVTALHNHIINQVHNGAIPPLVFKVWLPIVLRHDPSLLRSALLDGESRGIRYAGIKAVKRALKGNGWKKRGWDAVGGTHGMKEIFEVFGVWESRELARAIGASNTTKNPEKAAAIDELIKLIAPNLLPGTHSDSQGLTDQDQSRPLLSELVLLVQGCSSEFLAKCLSNPHFPAPLMDRIVFKLGHQHRDLLRKIAIGSTAVNSEVRKLVLRSCLSELVTSAEPWKPEHLLPAVSPGVPPGMRFCLDLIYESRINPPLEGCLQKNVLLGHVMTAVDVADRHRTSFRDILVLLELGISAADGRVGSPINLGDPLLVKLIHYWAFASFPGAEPHEHVDLAPTARKRQLEHPSRPKPEHRDSLEALLLQVIKKVPEYGIRPSNLSRIIRRQLFTNLDPEFPAAAKLPLIKLLCRHLLAIGIDLDSEVPSENEKLFLTWEIELLEALPCHDAKWLFERAISLRPLEQVITSSTSPWKGLLNEEKAVYVGQLLNVKWQAESEPFGDRVSPAARGLLNDIKKKAERQRDPNERLEFSRLAITIAVMSQSIKLLKEVFEWARRFLRDPNVGTSLPHDIFSLETAPLLSCAAPSVLKHPTPLSKLSSFVDEANSLLSFHIQTILLALREPSYNWYTYQGFLSLLRSVVSNRINGIRFRLTLELESESDLVETFLRSLTPIILEFERAATAEGHEQLGMAYLHGPLQDLCCPSSPSGPVLSFFDDLARQRDELWKQVRIEREPKVAILGDGWPKGLPVQSLLPSEDWAVAAFQTTGVAPFVSARVKEVVFCDPKTVLEFVPNVTSHIGRFCDSLKFSITSYVGKKSSIGREDRFLEVWDHYSNVVPADAGHMLELGRWLADFATSRGCTNVAKKINRAVNPPPPSLNQLPSIDSGPVEWDPWPETHRDSPGSKSIGSDENLTILRSRFHYQNWTSSLLANFSKPQPWETGITSQIRDIWDWTSKVRTLPLPTQEAILVSALLYLDSFNIESSRLLSKPFPRDIPRSRYPSVYLDYEFLSAISKVPDSAKLAVRVLRRLLSIAPPILLRDLANSLLKTLTQLPETSLRYADVQRALFGVTALLPLSDNPALVVDIGLKAIEEMPEASAWHRQIISLRLGRQLGHKDAQEMVRKFASFLFDALYKQRKGGKVHAEPETESDEDIDMLRDDESNAESQEDIEMIDKKDVPSHSKGKSQIKITTVKMLAQLLSEGNFTSLEFARTTLVSLFSASNHIDVRRAVAGALLESLRKSEDMGSDSSQRAYDALVSLPRAAAGPSERVNVSEAQWLEAENGAALPEVDTERPLFEFFIEEIRTLLPRRFNEMYVQDVVLPLLNESGKQHNRWMRAFLSRAGQLTSEENSVNFGPFGTVHEPEIVLKHWKPYLPKSYLRQYRDWALSHLICRKFEDFNDKLTLNKPEWRATEAGKYWVRYFTTNKTGKDLSHWKDLLELGVTTLVSDGITDQDLMDEFTAQASMIIRNPFSFSSLDSHSRVSLHRFNVILQQLQVPRIRSGLYSPRHDGWQQRVRPVLERIAKYREEVRSADGWSKNQEKNPVILPPLLQLRTRLLPYPHIDLGVPLREKRQNLFVSNVLALLDEIASSPSSLSDIKWLEEAAVKIAKDDHLPCLLGIGRAIQSNGESFEDCLKLQFMAAVVRNITSSDWGRKDEAEIAEFKAMREEWRKSQNEWVLTVAWTELEML